MIRSETVGDIQSLGKPVLLRNPTRQPVQRPRLSNPDVLAVMGKATSQSAATSAVLFYFGWVRTHALFAYFGIDPTLISYSTTDYLLRSVNVAFPPLIGAACVALALLGVHHVVVLRVLERSKNGRARRTLRWVILMVRVLATMLITVGIAGVFFPEQVWAPLGIVLPLLLIASSIVLGYATHLQSRYPDLLGRTRTCSQTPSFRLQRTALLALGLLASLWAVTLYANNHGAQTAIAWAARLPAEPTAVIYSTDRISLFGPGVQVAEVDQPGTKYHYQYSGMRLLARSNDKLLLLPVGWQHGRDTIFLIRDDNSIRVELIAE